MIRLSWNVLLVSSFLGVQHTNICYRGFPWEDENWCFSRLVAFVQFVLSHIFHIYFRFVFISHLPNCLFDICVEVDLIFVLIFVWYMYEIHFIFVWIFVREKENCCLSIRYFIAQEQTGTIWKLHSCGKCPNSQILQNSILEKKPCWPHHGCERK